MGAADRTSRTLDPILHREIAEDNPANEPARIALLGFSVEITVRRLNRALLQLPQTDYSQAVAKAIAWLGDRYLLARPINASQARRSLSPWFEDTASARMSATESDVIRK
jgi:hypothetical protein